MGDGSGYRYERVKICENGAGTEKVWELELKRDFESVKDDPDVSFLESYFVNGTRVTEQEAEELEKQLETEKREMKTVPLFH